MYIKINGVNYAPLITSLKRKADIVYSGNGGTTLDSTDIIDAKGTKISYTLTVDSAYKDQALLEQFWEAITNPTSDGVTVEMPYNQDVISFEAYVKTAEQSLMQADDDENVWGSVSINIIPFKPQKRAVG